MEADAPIERPNRLVCDDCGQEAHMVVTNLLDREVDMLCWPCMMKRALAVVQNIAAQEGTDTENA